MIAISVVVTFIVTLVVTALISIIITSMYYKKKLKVDNDDADLTRHLVIMHRNPAYVSSDERVEVANYAYISQETT